MGCVLDSFNAFGTIPAYKCQPSRSTDYDSRVLEMKISVVIPCYNAADYLPNAVSSILRQRINGTEIIVVDDKSSDNTLAVAEQLKQATET